jgi:hypothetical protein
MPPRRVYRLDYTDGTGITWRKQDYRITRIAGFFWVVPQRFARDGVEALNSVKLLNKIK